MKLKLTITELEKILEHAKHNEKGGNNASCVIELDCATGRIYQISGYAECDDLFIPVRAAVCEV